MRGDGSETAAFRFARRRGAIVAANRGQHSHTDRGMGWCKELYTYTVGYWMRQLGQARLCSAFNKTCENTAEFPSRYRLILG
jgi:hypothetical protein